MRLDARAACSLEEGKSEYSNEFYYFNYMLSLYSCFSYKYKDRKKKSSVFVSQMLTKAERN